MGRALERAPRIFRSCAQEASGLVVAAIMTSEVIMVRKMPGDARGHVGAWQHDVSERSWRSGS
jgi:hypothetical protein